VLTLEDVVGRSGKAYNAGDWELSVVFPLVDPSRTEYRVLITNRATRFSWEGKVSVGDQITELSTGNDPSPEWLVYTNDVYGFAFSYPPSWTLMEEKGGQEIAGGRASPSVTLCQDTGQVKIQFKHTQDPTILGPRGRSAGQVKEQGSLTFLAQ
jgi:hypothetical protein